MKTPLHVIAELLAKRLSSDTDKRRLSQEIAAYLLDTGRTGELDSLARDLISARANDGVVEVSAVSARKLSEAALKDIRSQVRELYSSAQKIIITEVQDPSVIGGVRLEFPGRQLDLSVRSKLNHFKQKASAHGTF